MTDVERLHVDQNDRPTKRQHTVPPDTEQRRQQNQALEAYILANIDNDDFFKSTTTSEGYSNESRQHPADSNDSTESARPGKTASQNIISNPRDYQLELFEQAKHENLIAVLDTGSGKTLISVLLLRWTIDQELEARAQGKSPRISLFVVQSVNLVIQQAGVLRSNLDHPIVHLYGELNLDTQSKLVWKKLFDEHKIVVCTADILLECLSRKYLHMSQINLMIFDEAHHAKKDHAFARISQEYYWKCDQTTRPRIFSMTASPLDTKTDVAKEAARLEMLLDSKIVTAGQMTELKHLNKAKDGFLGYEPNNVPNYGEILKDLKQDFGKLNTLMTVVKAAQQVAIHLGNWCGDRYLLELAENANKHKLLLTAKEDLRKKYANITVQQMDSVLKHYEEALTRLYEASKHKEKAPDLKSLSPKSLGLLKYLHDHFRQDSESRCLIFVKERNTARLLKLAFDALQSENIRVDYLVGNESKGIIDVGLTFKQQSEALLRFRKGESNCLFVTSVAEEGLDIAECNLVIRFDLYDTMIQCVQSRGRARRHDSQFIHMFENGNSIHQGVIKSVKYQEMQMRLWCSQLPAERKLLFEDDYDENDDRVRDQKRIYEDPVSGARLDFGNSLLYLANMVAVMSSSGETPKHPTYVVSPRGMKFIAEVLLPPDMPLTSVIGTICSRKGLAKRSAAFEACLELRKKDYLDEHFVPTYVKKLPAMRNALLAVKAKALVAYPMMTKPSVWKQEVELPMTKVWLTTLSFLAHAQSDYRTLVVVTRIRMPDFPSIPLFDTGGNLVEVECKSIQKAISVCNKQLEQLSACTFQILLDTFSKDYERELSKMPYFIAPGLSLSNQSSSEMLDWPLIEKIASSRGETWDSTWCTTSLLNKLLVDPWSDRRKVVVTGIHPTLKPSDPVREDAEKTKHNTSILDYSNSIRNDTTRAAAKFDLEQPVLITHKLDQRRNLLVRPTKKESEFASLAYICPEPFRVSPIPPSMARSCLAWPSIITRLEAVLISLEACSKTGIECQPQLALAAVTKNTVEDDSSAQTDHGMGENYERLEFLGDCFLKMATSLSVFVNHPTDDEFEYHVKRMLMLCNQNLFNVSRKLDLAPYIRSKGFNRRLWYPEGLNLLTGNGAGQDSVKVFNTQQQQLSEKTIADVSEALIGAAFMSHNIPGSWKAERWTNVVTAVTKLVDNPDHTMLAWQDYEDAYKIPDYQKLEANASQRDMAAHVEKSHPYHFKSATLLRSAFLHPSYPYIWEGIPNYQRLEFLGDALLDLVIISFLFYKYPDKDEQWLTEAKMVIVSNRFLGMLACHLGFHKHLRHNTAVLEAQIRVYAAEAEEARAAANGSCDYWTAITNEPPKCLADVVEAYVAAVFIDSEFDFTQVQTFFDQHIKWYFDDMSLFSSYVKAHPVTAFQDLLNKKYGCSGGRSMNRELGTVSNAERQQQIVAIMIHAEVVAHSTGVSTRYASVRAGKIALELLENVSVKEFREKYGCDCKS